MDLVIINLDKESANVIRYIAEKSGAIIMKEKVSERKAFGKSLKENSRRLAMDATDTLEKELLTIIDKRLKGEKVTV